MKDTRTGWVVTSECNTYLLTFTFHSTRSGSICKFKESILGDEKLTWAGYRNRGHKCVHAQMTIETTDDNG